MRKRVQVLLISTQTANEYRTQSRGKPAVGDLGIRYLAAYLLEHNIPVDIVSAHANEASQTLSKIRELASPGVVGVSANLAFQRHAKDLVAAVKQQRPDLTVVAGGFFPTFAAQRVLVEHGADWVIRGEGEASLLALVRNVLDKESPVPIPGTVCRVGTQLWEQPRAATTIDPDRLPWPLRSRATLPSDCSQMLVSASRGCYHNCRFCSVPAFHPVSGTSAWRGRDPEHVAEELAFLVHDLGASFLHFVDDSFLGPREPVKRAIDLRDALSRRRLRVPFRVSLRASDVNRDTMLPLIEAGLCAVQLGVESFSERQLHEVFHKGIKAEVNRRAAALLDEFGIHYQMGLILFEPSVQLKEISSSLEDIRTTRLGTIKSPCSVLQCADGTDLARDLVARGASLGLENGINHQWAFEDPRVSRALDLARTFEAQHSELGPDLLAAITPPATVSGDKLNKARQDYFRYRDASLDALACAVEGVSKCESDEVVLKSIEERCLSTYRSLGSSGASTSQSHSSDTDDALPLVAHVELTNRCNLRCRVCANQRMSRARGDMPWSVYTQVLDRLCDVGGRQVILNTIGETLMYPRVLEAVEAAHKRGLFTVVSTNGQALSPVIARGLLEHGCGLVRVSVQATTDEEYLREHEGGDFLRLLENVRSLREERDRLGADTIIRVRCVVSREHCTSSQELFEEFWSPLVDQVEIMPFGNMGGRNGALPRDDPRRTYCRTIWRGFNVLLDGRVSYCPCDFDGELIVGSVLENSFDEIWNSAAFLEVRRRHRAGLFDTLLCCERCDATRTSFYEAKRPRTTEVEERIMDEYFAGWRDGG